MKKGLAKDFPGYRYKAEITHFSSEGAWMHEGVVVAKRPFVLLESPYSSPERKKLVENFNYAKAILNDSISKGESPFLSHLFYTQFLNDRNKDERQEGMEAGWAMLHKADLVAVYLDYGWTDGMVEGIIRAVSLGVPWERRKIGWPLEKEKP